MARKLIFFLSMFLVFLQSFTKRGANAHLMPAFFRRVINHPGPYVILSTGGRVLQSSDLVNTQYEISNDLPTNPPPTIAPVTPAPSFCTATVQEPFCLTVPDYPQNEIDQICSKQIEAIKRFMAKGMREDAIQQKVLEKRDGNSVEGTKVCPTREKYIKPLAAKNDEGEVKYIVNSEKYNIIQMVKSEICITENCAGVCQIPLGYTSKCEQQFVLKRLLTYDEKGKSIVTDTFWFPHGCACTIYPE